LYKTAKRLIAVISGFHIIIKQQNHFQWLLCCQ